MKGGNMLQLKVDGKDFDQIIDRLVILAGQVKAAGDLLFHWEDKLPDAGQVCCNLGQGLSGAADEIINLLHELAPAE